MKTRGARRSLVACCRGPLTLQLCSPKSWRGSLTRFSGSGSPVTLLCKCIPMMPMGGVLLLTCSFFSILGTGFIPFWMSSFLRCVGAGCPSTLASHRLSRQCPRRNRTEACLPLGGTVPLLGKLNGELPLDTLRRLLPCTSLATPSLTSCWDMFVESFMAS